MKEEELRAYRNKAIEKDRNAIENRLNHAFNQGYEMGRKMAKTRWIPVSERLPDECQKVLVQAEDMYYYSGNNKGIVIGWHISGYWSTHTIKGCENIHYPVAWMPLPTPYKAESEDKE